MSMLDPNWTLPMIDPQRCTGCGDCQDYCPTQAVALIDKLAVIIHPEACTFCDRCERLCPAEAISRPFTIQFAPQQLQSPPKGQPGLPAPLDR
jgi:ferredoxin